MSSLAMLLISLLRIVFIKNVEGKRVKRHKSQRGNAKGMRAWSLSQIGLVSGP